MVIPEWLWQITQWRRYKWAIVACQAVALGVASYLLGIKHHVGNKPVSTISETEIRDKASGQTGVDQVDRTLTVEQARGVLSQHGWSFASELTVDQTHYITYDRWLGDLRLKCQFVHYPGDSKLRMVWCAASGEEVHVTPVRDALVPLWKTMDTLIPGSDQAIRRAIAAQQVNDAGVRRMQGEAITRTGWQMTVIEYLEGPELPGERNFVVFSAIRT